MARPEASAESSAMESLTWLDCTLRDGGYQNNWEFPDRLTNRYLQAMGGLGADRVELGFRTLSNHGYKGPTAFTSDSFLDSLEIPSGLRLGVMVNVSELAETADSRAAQLDALFPSDSRRHVSFVRLAAHISEVDTAIEAAGWLWDREYEVALNVMQISEAQDSFLTSIGSRLSAAAVDVLYVADSLGSLNPEKTKTIVSQIRNTWPGAIGFHGHDNLGLALANSLSAVDAGATWLDSTVFGMGRGAGNTRSELLFGHLAGGREEATTEELQNIIADYFQPLQTVSNWGPNLHYVSAARQGIHPTFVQELTAHSSYSYSEQVAAIEALASGDSQKFSVEKLNEALTWVQKFDSQKSVWDQSEMFSGSTVLLLGAGQSVSTNLTALESFIHQTRPLTIATNLGGTVADELIDAHIACHPLRLLGDAKQYATMRAKLIAPASLLPDTVAREMSDVNRLLNVGLTQTSETVAAEPGLVSLPAPQVLAYSLLVCLSGGAQRIYLAGFDGYDENDPRRQVEQKLVNNILGASFPGEVIALTPTQFDVTQSSVHGLLS